MMERKACDVCSEESGGSILHCIDKECQAYILGWISVFDRSLEYDPPNEFIKIPVPSEMIGAFTDTLQGITNFVDIDSSSHSVHLITIACAATCKDARRHLSGTCEGRLPEFANESLLWDFVRGCFDCGGWINPSGPECSFYVPNLTPAIAALAGIQTSPDASSLMGCGFKGTNCIDFLGRLYGRASDSPYKMAKNYFKYTQCLSSPTPGHLPRCTVYKTDPDAIVPCKTNTSDVGFDITVIRRVKQLNGSVTLYDTGIKISMQTGYYAEIVPRSSLSKSGFMLANSVGIIDPGYTGNLYVALARNDPGAAEPSLPFRCCQLIVRPQTHATMIAIDVDDVEEAADGFALSDSVATARGEGGFGSTG